MTRVLLVEDDSRIVGFLHRGLAAEGYSVDAVADGREALTLARDNHYPIVILDRMLPGLDGLDICRRLREEGRDSAVLMLTARDSLQDKLDGLAGGADDYLTKPFAFDELLARMHALLRRGPYREAASELKVGDLVLSLADHSARRGERTITLTAKEFALLRYLMENAGKVLSRARLLSNVWGYNFEPGTKVVDVYIRYLRRKIDEGAERPLIHTVRGFGYKIADEPSAGGGHDDLAHDRPA
jgi:two-component system, OmpR family, response regulator